MKPIKATVVYAGRSGVKAIADDGRKFFFGAGSQNCVNKPVKKGDKLELIPLLQRGVPVWKPGVICNEK